MRDTIYLDSKDVPQYLRGGYTGKTFKAIVTDSICVPQTAGLWEGGSRDTYRFVELSTGRSVDSPCQQTAPSNQQRQEFNAPLPAGIAMVEHTIFCGKDHGLTFYVHPDSAAKLLPSESVELTPNQKLVLNATASLKSSYNGKDRYENSKPYGALTRLEIQTKLAALEPIMEARGNVELKSGKRVGERIAELKGWTYIFPTREEWDLAKAQLMMDGYLNKAGAITTKGRNAR
jgi:hypothetical protein